MKTDAAKKKKGAFQQVGTVGRKALPHLPYCSSTLRMFFLYYLTLVLSCGGVHSCDTKADVGPRVQVTHVPKKDALKGKSPILVLLTFQRSSGLTEENSYPSGYTRHARLQSLKTHTHSQISLGHIFTLWNRHSPVCAHTHTHTHTHTDKHTFMCVCILYFHTPLWGTLDCTANP